MTQRLPDTVIWHDAECGAYEADLPLWRSLAQAADGPLLDIGAGTGRVTLDLAGRGHRVTAVEREAELLAVLERRAGALPVTAVLADARRLDLGRRFALCLVPMQTIQLLGGERERAQFLRSARTHLQPGAVLAAAIAEELPAFEPVGHQPLPLPDLREVDGRVYCSQPLAIRHRDGRMVLERRREVVAPDGERTVARDVVELDRLDAAQLEDEAAAAGFVPATRAEVPPTPEHVGSIVVVLHA